MKSGILIPVKELQSSNAFPFSNNVGGNTTSTKSFNPKNSLVCVLETFFVITILLILYLDEPKRNSHLRSSLPIINVPSFSNTHDLSFGLKEISEKERDQY